MDSSVVKFSGRLSKMSGSSEDLIEILFEMSFFLLADIFKSLDPEDSPLIWISSRFS